MISPSQHVELGRALRESDAVKKGRTEVMPPHNVDPLSENIRYLISRMPSIAVASKEMGINRQQLNKYLNGSSSPSLRTMRKMATVFELPTEALMLPPEELKRRMKHGSGAEPSPLPARKIREVTLIGRGEAEHDGSAEALAPYCGRYFRYNWVPEMPELVLRTAVIIFQRERRTYAGVLERFAPAGSPWSRDGVRRTLHRLSYVQDRIQFIDCGTPTGEVTPWVFALLSRIHLRSAVFERRSIGEFRLWRTPDLHLKPRHAATSGGGEPARRFPGLRPCFF